MITGNFSLLAGIESSVDEWWFGHLRRRYSVVEQPNTLGMALFADGGLLATKPYAASANYTTK